MTLDEYKDLVTKQLASIGIPYGVIANAFDATDDTQATDVLSLVATLKSLGIPADVLQVFIDGSNSADVSTYIRSLGLNLVTYFTEDGDDLYPCYDCPPGGLPPDPHE